MKRYLSVLIMLAATAANAQNNPFDLKENLQKIDHAQSVFLDELKLLVQQKEALEESKQEDEIFAEPDTEEKRSAIGMTQNTQAPVKPISPSEKENKETEGVNAEAERALRPKAAQAPQIQNSNPPQEQLGIKQNTDKDYQEAVQEADSEAQESAKKEKNIAVQIQDINISKEQAEAKQNADKDYQQAVQEMDEEK